MTQEFGAGAHHDLAHLIARWNDTYTEFPLDKPFIGFLEGVDPGREAVRFHGTSTTYGELLRTSDAIASLLVLKGVSPGERVALALDRSPLLIACLLGIMKAGATYIPVDPLYPKKRIEYVLDDSQSKFVITSSQWKGQFGAHEILIDQEDLARVPDVQLPPVNSGQLAYIMYTSGSTGDPKGIAVTHRNLSNFLFSMKGSPGIAADDRLLAVTTVSFDISGLELYLPLLAGACVVLADSDEARDGRRLVDLITSERISVMQATPATWRMMIDSGWSQRQNLKMLCGGEALPPDLSAMLLQRGDQLWNMYGPTETTIWSAIKRIKEPTDEITIGRPIANTRIYILDEELNLLGPGQTGEIYIGGEGLAEGYLNKPELTARAFIQYPPVKEPRIYRTGDLGEFTADGEVRCYGRIDNQVKIRGHRIELGAIEHALSLLPEVAETVVLAREDSPGDQRLVAYIVRNDSSGAGQAAAADRRLTSKWRAKLSDVLPAYMLPNAYILIPAIPRLPNGKIDRKALPAPAHIQNRTIAAPGASGTEGLLINLWQSLFNTNVGRDDNFFDLGGSSLLATRFIASLENDHGLKISVTKLYQYPVLREFAAAIDGTPLESPDRRMRPSGADIAIIAMSGRFPGAKTVEEFWSNLKEGRESITFFEEAELDKTIPAALRENALYVKARGVLEEPDKFDAEFFGIAARTAEIMDPQQRLLIEMGWEALEAAGYIPSKYHGRIGIYAGCGSNTYYQNNLATRPDITGEAGHFQVLTLSDKDYVAMRAAYHLNLKGPAVSVYSSSSTSLLAIAQAADSIRNGRCDMALAGGVTVHTPVNSGHLYEEGAMFSRDGHSRPFDADATGTVFSDGGGLVLLKSLEEAIADGDQVVAVIKGVGVSNDGANKASFTAPHPAGQAAAIRMAFSDGNIDPATVTYVEAHGTATPIGDPIEFEGLVQAFSGVQQQQYCAVGSVKGNIGHLTHGAGVAGLIKTALSLRDKILVPTLNFETPNPAVNFANSPFYMCKSLQPWESEGPRRAGVSSFGMGGTNVHVILEEFLNSNTEIPELKQTPQIIGWSAKTEAGLNHYGKRLGDFLTANPDVRLEDIAYSLQQRQLFGWRRFVVTSDAADLLGQLSAGPKAAKTLYTGSDFQDAAMMFPGQGSQYPGMGRDIYKSNLVFKSSVDVCAELLKQWIKEDIRDVLFSKDEATADSINDTRFTQPALFVIEYAAAQMWQSWGVNPLAYVGHSIGEFVAAHLAGVFSLADALKLVSERARLIASQPRGSMLAVKSAPGDLQALLPHNLSIAAHNAPELSVVSGPSEVINAFAATLSEKGIAARALSTSHAFHSPMMDGIIDDFKRVVESVTLSPPRKPIVSTVTGTWMSDAQATDPVYWSRQLREPVMFAKAISTLLAEGNYVLLECGPGTATSVFARQQSVNQNLAVVPGFNDPGVGSEYLSVLNSLGQLWQRGLDIDWPAFHQNSAKKIFLPSYAFQKQRFWIEPGQPQAVFMAQPQADDDRLREVGEPTAGVSDKEAILKRIAAVIEKSSGIEIGASNWSRNFIELGLDSLLLTQLAILLKREFRTSVSFRQLNEDLNSPELLAEFLLVNSPEDFSSTPVQQKNRIDIDLSPEELAEVKKPFGASPRIETKSSTLNARQFGFLKDFKTKYTSKTRKSKEYTQNNRRHMADPRVVSGFRPATKELVYPIVAGRSKGSRIWDIDGNEYIDALNGFGSNMLGYQPDMLANAIKEQIDKGYEIGPQHELAAEVCKLVCDFTGLERAAICSTGSEAVMGTMRIARTVTGRSLIVAFSGSYHGIFDEVIVRGTKQFRSIPAASGIMPDALQNMLILDYGTEESMAVIRERAGELAAVLVEPVQSRRPDFQPVDFLKEVREITRQSGTALIFDEVITGFRMHPGGAQAIFGIQADIASYGKVIGGGLPIGVIAGKSEFMDALDGGFWNYGDDSIPEAGVTYFAGTFVRHPLALAAAKASLEYFKMRGPALQNTLNEKTASLRNRLSQTCRELQLPIEVVGFGSLWRFRFTKEVPYSELLFTLMRFHGIHIIDGFPCFVTEAHTDEELNQISEIFRRSINELISAGFLEEPVQKSEFTAPVSGARLGRDRNGNPAWFVPDPDRPGKYLQIKN